MVSEILRDHYASNTLNHHRLYRTMKLSFHILDYVVMTVFITVSFGIGIFFGVYRKQGTTENYLLGNRKLHLLPVGLSLVVTFQSAASVLGLPAEIYLYHTMFIYNNVAIILAVVIQGVFIAPLVHPLKLTSAYEYLGRRYQSRAVQLLGTFLGMLQTLFYMAAVLYSPALALEAVAQIPLWLSVAVIGVIGTLYTSLGGIKSVVWTDVFQFVVLYGGLIGVFVIGLQKVGGFSGMIEQSSEAHRLVFDIVDPDPRVRHTVWSCLIGGFFLWLPNICNQSSVQRMSSVRTVRESRMSVFLNIPFIILFVTTLTLVGLMLFAYYRIIQCDPIEAGYINNPNQVVPHFVMMVLHDVPGLTGIFVAALFSGALSSLSSGINAMSANTLQDVIIGCIQGYSQRTKTLIAKVLVLIYGLIAIILAYLAKYLPGPVTQIGNTCMGASGGPVAGIMFLGAMFPQANYIGAMFGGILGIAVNAWIAMGSLLYGRRTPMSPLNPTTGCQATNITSHWNSTFPNNVIYLTNTTLTTELTTISTDGPPDTSDHLAIYDVSYMYFGMIGFLTTYIVGLIVSLLTRKVTKPTPAEYIVPCLRRLWKVEYVGLNTTEPVKQEMDMTEIKERPDL